MYRTSEEEREYQNLDSASKKRYNLEVELNPSLTHKQVIKIVCKNDILVRELRTGNEINFGNNETRKTILKKMDDWLWENARSVWHSVTNEIRQAINYLEDLISRGIDWLDKNVFGPIADWLDDVFG